MAGQKSNRKAFKTVSVNITERFKKNNAGTNHTKHVDDSVLDSREQQDVDQVIPPFTDRDFDMESEQSQLYKHDIKEPQLDVKESTT